MCGISHQRHICGEWKEDYFVKTIRKLSMEREVYIKPIMQIEEVMVEAMIAASVTIGEDMDILETDANKRRGSWGNLWE